jgi:hypothetical protein
MHFAPLRPWQNGGQPRAVDPVPEPLSEPPTTAMADIPNLGAAKGEYLAAAQVVPALPVEPAARRAARPPREEPDSASMPPPGDEAWEGPPAPGPGDAETPEDWDPGSG